MSESKQRLLDLQRQAREAQSAIYEAVTELAEFKPGDAALRHFERTGLHSAVVVIDYDVYGDGTWNYIVSPNAGLSGSAIVPLDHNGIPLDSEDTEELERVKPEHLVRLIQR